MWSWQRHGALFLLPAAAAVISGVWGGRGSLQNQLVGVFGQWCVSVLLKLAKRITFIGRESRRASNSLICGFAAARTEFHCQFVFSGKTDVETKNNLITVGDFVPPPHPTPNPLLNRNMRHSETFFPRRGTHIKLLKAQRICLASTPPPHPPTPATSAN